MMIFSINTVFVQVKLSKLRNSQNLFLPDHLLFHFLSIYFIYKV